MSHRSRRGRGEDGAALELALVFLTAIAIFVGALIGFTDTSSRATVATRTARNTDYDADALMQADIATIRVTTTSGVVGNCPVFTAATPTPALTLNGSYKALHVDCLPSSTSTSTPTRHVVLAVCDAAVSCFDASATALLRADVVFYDDRTFGRALSIQSWSDQ